MSKEGHAESRRSEVLYVSGSARVDCCCRCRHSRMAWGRLYCHLVRGTVQQMGVCVQWAPVRRWVAA